MTYHSDESTALAAAAAESTHELEVALRFGGIHYELEQTGAPAGGCQLSVLPSDTYPWTVGDVEGNLQAAQIIAEVKLQQTPWLDSGPMLTIKLPTPHDIRNINRLIETGLPELRSAALRLHRALIAAEITEPAVAVRTRVVELAPLAPPEAVRLFRRLGGDRMTLVDLDLDDPADHQRFAAALQEVLRTSTERALLATSLPTCGNCRHLFGRSKVLVDLLDTPDALALAHALSAAPIAPRPSPET